MRDGLLQDAKQMKLDVLSAVHFMSGAWRLITPTTIKNCFMKCGSSIDHVSSNVDSAVKRMTDTGYNLLTCSLKITQYVRVFLRFVKFRVPTKCQINISLGQKKLIINI
jgi:hypothetical protein